MVHFVTSFKETAFLTYKLPRFGLAACSCSMTIRVFLENEPREPLPDS
jgi:hypothetical protein